MSNNIIKYNPFKRAFRRAFRFLILHLLPFLKPLAVRLPFSRFHYFLRLCFSGEEEITLRQIRVKVNPGDDIGYYPFFFGVYSTHEVNKIIELSARARIFVDVGANIGLVSLAVARACPGLEVYAFEPEPEIARNFRENLSLNPDLSARVHLIEKAIADKRGQLFFCSSGNPENLSTGKISSEKTGRRVEAETLDNFFQGIEKFPDLVKIDIEGAELLALKGMEGLFAKGYPETLVVEVHLSLQKDPQAFQEELTGMLRSWNFSLFRLNHHGSWEQLGKITKDSANYHLLGVREK